MSNFPEASPAGAPLGDPLPAALATYYTALDAGRADEAAAAFAVESHYAVPMPGPETQPRLTTVGRQALVTRLRERGAQPFRHVVKVCAVEGERCLLEGVTATPDGAEHATFVASVTVRSGAIDRYLAFGCLGARDALPTAVPITTSPTLVGDVLHRYFGALDAGEFAAAAACFAPDVLYSHPPYQHTDIDSDQRVEFRGRDKLTAAFISRGRQAFGHRIVACIQRGPHALLEGVVDDLPGGGTGSFISSLSLDIDGLIERYVSFYCEPSVPDP